MNRSVRKSQQSIKNALITLMAKKDLQLITIPSLCDEADVSRTTFYNHYSSIMEVYDILFEESLAKLKKFVNENSAVTDTKSFFKCLYLFSNEDINYKTIFSYVFSLNPKSKYFKRITTVFSDYIPVMHDPKTAEKHYGGFYLARDWYNGVFTTKEILDYLDKCEN